MTLGRQEVRKIRRLQDSKRLPLLGSELEDIIEGVALIIQSGGTVRFMVNSTGVGFYATVPVARVSAYTQTYSTADKTHATPTVGADIGAFTDPPSAAEMAALRTFVNALKADHADVAQFANSIVDDLQTYGLFV